jgi:hypothetical protein
MPVELTKPFEGHSVTLTVHVTRRFRIRLWLGLFLLKLAVRVLDVGFELIWNDATEADGVMRGPV